MKKTIGLVALGMVAGPIMLASMNVVIYIVGLAAIILGGIWLWATIEEET